MLLRERRQIVICVAAVAMVGGFVVFRYLPLRDRIKTVRQTKNAELIALNKSQAQSRQLPDLDALLAELQESTGDYEARIPQQRELGVFLRRIADLMNRHNLKEQVVEPGEQINSAKVNCIPVNVRCKGELVDLFGFFKGLQALDRLVRIEQVKLTNGVDFGGEVTMQTKAVIYCGAQVGQG